MTRRVFEKLRTKKICVDFFAPIVSGREKAEKLSILAGLSWDLAGLKSCLRVSLFLARCLVGKRINT